MEATSNMDNVVTVAVGSVQEACGRLLSVPPPSTDCCLMGDGFYVRLHTKPRRSTWLPGASDRPAVDTAMVRITYDRDAGRAVEEGATADGFSHKDLGHYWVGGSIFITGDQALEEFRAALHDVLVDDPFESDSREYLPSVSRPAPSTYPRPSLQSGTTHDFWIIP